ncbi:MAG: winged helix-turn-helix domain-containing protein [Gammaproteobacteria bacterium]|nr:winged helix-turn-helix domain-containing protein [Gammaproteobacteria bacterium]MDH3450596.1 winged helix-turn-helix domain-containing protein [Gammaproteobacteria bacterium]
MSEDSTAPPTRNPPGLLISQMVAGAADAAFAIDDHHHVVAWNRTAEQLLGYAPEEVIGLRCEEALQAVLPGGEPLCRPNCDVFRCFRDCHPSAVPNCRVRCKDGNWISVGYSSVVMPEQNTGPANGSIIAVIFLRDRENERLQSSPNGLLQIYMLGKFGLVASERSLDIEKWKRRQAVTLLKFLVTHVGRPVHRERILDCLWPDVDEERSWGRLKVTMYYLRTQLRAGGADKDTIRTVGSAYLLKRDAVWVDAENFEKLASEGRALQSKGRCDEALRCFDEALYLYRGDYLEQDVYADWCAEERERLGEIYLDMLARKAECHARRSEYTEAVQVCRKGLVQDPCRESLHCSLMQYLIELGKTDSALAQYRQCREVLGREFGVEPMPETQQIYQQILARHNRESTTAPALQLAGRSRIKARGC